MFIGDLQLKTNQIGIGEISYNILPTKNGIYSIYLGDHILIAIPKGIRLETIKNHFKKTEYFVSSGFSSFSFLDPSRIPLIGPLPIEGPSQYTLPDEISENIKTRISLFEGLSTQCEKNTENICNYQLKTKNHIYDSIHHKKEHYSEIYMDGQLWMIYASNRLGDGGLPIYQTSTPIKEANAFLVYS
jgi:hypothetical protein